MTRLSAGASPEEPIDLLLSVPQAVSAAAGSGNLAPRAAFTSSDPPGLPLGSAGGTVHLLVEAWHATGAGRAFGEWLQAPRKLVVHGGGQSRRLPAYAPGGKPCIPIPAMRWDYGQRLDQTLLDLQAPDYMRLLRRAHDRSVVMVASGDVLLRYDADLPILPQADVVVLGMQVPPEVAADFGVFFVARSAPERLAFMLQKPSPERIRELQGDYDVLVDTGMWLLSARAIEVLLARSGVGPVSELKRSERSTRGPSPMHAYGLYTEFGLALGSRPQCADPDVAGLTCAVAALPDAEFYHLGTSRQMIESVCRLQNRGWRSAVPATYRSHPDQIVQNACFDTPTRRDRNHTLWVENSSIPASWELADSHVLTGVPSNDWALRLRSGDCLDFVPVLGGGLCIRAYGIDDPFSGAVGDAATLWFGRRPQEWFAARGLDLVSAGIDLDQDIQEAPLFPVLEPEEITGGYVQWLLGSEVYQIGAEAWAQHAERWLRSRRLSATAIAAQADLQALARSRDELRRVAIGKLYHNRRSSVFYRLDLESTASIFAGGSAELPDRQNAGEGSAGAWCDRMFRAEVKRKRGFDGSPDERAAFDSLCEAILGAGAVQPVSPRCMLLPDQIVWARSPVRLDLAGGWTDTPPYCLQHGGRVVNVAVDLNGQPPIQVYVRRSERPVIVLHSIDRGAGEVIETFEQLDTYARPGSAFALARAALAQAGFLPRFHAEGGCATLRDQLEAFGSGLEISLLAAVPQGSGLGTSSILAATLLGALSDVCGLHWSREAIIARTLALEQMMTTGGGWQDQVGGAMRGIKLAETAPGPGQAITVRWLPETLFAEGCSAGTILLYYTGITRMAKGILQQIVRGMFLNAADRLAIVRDIGANAGYVADALQRADWDGFAEGIRRSWDLNRRLDAGTNPPEVQAVLRPIEDHLAACKLLGAGGGGYLLMVAKDEEAGRRIRRVLSESGSQATGRFCGINVSQRGLDITHS